jgi:hypothetical protein
MMVQQSGHVVSPCALLVLPDTNPAAATSEPLGLVAVLV